MKNPKNKQQNKLGFTLIEMLVVVLIIGILAGIALPQYQMAVTKAKVASILPLMRRWKDALAEYKLQHDDYLIEDTSILGVNWPSDWKHTANLSCGYDTDCYNDYWNCSVLLTTGVIVCGHDDASITMYQADDPDCEVCRDKITCYSDMPAGVKICKAIGSKLLYGDDNEAEYQI